jgi:hypothetical protein
MASDPLLLTTAALTRAVCRLFVTHGYAPLTEVPLADGRRADILAIGPRGEIRVAELKVSLPDLRADRKWPAYLEWCDAFFWAVPDHLAAHLDHPDYAPDSAGLIVGDAHHAVFLREGVAHPLNAARRRAVTHRVARLAATRLARLADPALDSLPLF